MTRVAALFVDPKGVYANLPGVDVWDEARDARLYAGPWPVVAHPPCARWSRLAGFTEARFGYKRGEDGGCFGAALRAVREFGGVLEHPAYSAAWARFDLPRPQWHGGWTHSLTDSGASCYVEQGRYGLPVKKATWLYACGVDLPELRWGLTPDGDGEEPNGPWGGIENWRDRWKTMGRAATPVEFCWRWPARRVVSARVVRRDRVPAICRVGGSENGSGVNLRGEEAHMGQQYRQGDILIRPVKAIPGGLTAVNHRTLAEGEATGHLHEIADTNATLITPGEADELRAWYLLVQDAPVELTHPEHGTITLEPGSYEVLRQRSYTPAENLRVAD